MGTKAAAVPRIVWGRTRRGFNRALDRLEVSMGRGKTTTLPHAPILIVGAPRCGSTLLYQLLVRRFDVTYLSNLHCALFGAPSLVERLTGGRLLPPDDYESLHGRTLGWAAPSECGPYWYRFFRKYPQYVPLAEADRSKLERLRASCVALTLAGDRPVVFKNLLCSLRLRPIADALPEALFVVVRRDLADHSRSLLAARKHANGNYTQWFSAEPPEIDQLRALPPHEAVVEQIRRLEALIEDDRSAVGQDRFHDVRYEHLCADTVSALDAIATFARDRGASLAHRAHVPASFDSTSRSTLDPDLERQLQVYLAELGVHGG